MSAAGMAGRGRREFWPEGFQPHDPRGIAAHAWYAEAEDLDPASLPEAGLRRLLGEALGHVRQLLDSSDESDRYENSHEREGTHVLGDGMAAVIRGEDLLTVREALDGAGMWARDTDGPLQQVAKYRAIARALDADR